MDNITPTQLWAAVLAVASAIVLLYNAFKAIANAWQAAKAPNEKQNKRISDLEVWRRGVDEKLDKDKKRLDIIEEGNRASQRALLALLDHGIDGNNTKQMEEAKEELRNHLINKP